MVVFEQAAQVAGSETGGSTGTFDLDTTGVGKLRRSAAAR
jgi:hypothetical protein